MPMRGAWAQDLAQALIFRSWAQAPRPSP